MIKINKQVAKSRISCFLETNEVVLFFHCNNSVYLNKNDNLLGLNEVEITCEPRRESVTNISNVFFKDPYSIDINASFYQKRLRGNEMSKRQVTYNQNTFQSMMVKNRLAKKAFLERNIEKLPSHNPFPKKGLASEKKSCLTSSLFNGPTLLLGCSSVRMLKKGVNACAKHKGFLLLGALYQNSIINHSQVKRLIANSNSDQGYIKLMASMRSPILRPTCLIRYLLSMRSLSVHQDRLICLFKVRRQQILEA
jgi:ribosomal protein L10